MLKLPDGKCETRPKRSPKVESNVHKVVVKRGTVTLITGADTPSSNTFTVDDFFRVNELLNIQAQ